MSEREDDLRGRRGDGPAQHYAGPLLGGVQRCIRCKGVLIDYRESMTCAADRRVSGFAEGPVVVDGNFMGAALDPAAAPCTEEPS